MVSPPCFSSPRDGTHARGLRSGRTLRRAAQNVAQAQEQLARLERQAGIVDTGLQALDGPGSSAVSMQMGMARVAFGSREVETVRRIITSSSTASNSSPRMPARALSSAAITQVLEIAAEGHGSSDRRRR
jgi:hypothetical protein